MYDGKTSLKSSDDEADQDMDDDDEMGEDEMSEINDADFE